MAAGAVFVISGNGLWLIRLSPFQPKNLCSRFSAVQSQQACTRVIMTDCCIFPFTSLSNFKDITQEWPKNRRGTFASHQSRVKPYTLLAEDKFMSLDCSIFIKIVP